tara:strand:- start:80 stop:472 length:393 start_codon:yes stop_codon:yes gene_type:complete
MGGRLPVDGKKVQEFRITLGTFERDRLDTLITGLTVKNVANPFVALISDISALTFLFTAYMTYIYGEPVTNFLLEEYEDISDFVKTINEIENAKEIGILVIKNAVPFGLGYLPDIIRDAMDLINGENNIA